MRPVARSPGRRRRGWRFYGASEPAYKLDPGHPKHPRLRQGPQGPGARCLDFDPGVPRVGGARREGAMEVLYPRCAGLDVHKDSVVAGVRLATGGPAKTEVRRFDTTTPGLLALSAWLTESGCTHVAMEATGVYWKPVWHILADGDLTLILA